MSYLYMGLVKIQNLFGQFNFSMALLLQIEQAHFKKQYQQTLSLPSATDDFQFLLVTTLSARTTIYKLLTSKQQAWREMVEKQKNQYQSTLQSKSNSVEKQIISLFSITMQYFVFEIVNSSDVSLEEEKRLLKLLDKLPSIHQFSNRPNTWKFILNSLILCTSFMELQLKRIIATKRVVNSSDLQELKLKLREIAYAYPVTNQYCKKSFTILSHLTIYNLNITTKQNQRLIAIIKIILHDGSHNKTLLSQDTKIVILYNCLKTLLGTKQLSDSQEDMMQQLYKTLQIKAVKRYEEHLLHLFFVVKGLIFAKGKVMEGDGEDSEEEVTEQDRTMTQALSSWVSINLDQTMLSLQEVNRNIIRHRVASLATLISMRLNLPRFCLNFLELMHDGPFNNDAQTIKLCFQLFQARQFSKLNNPLQIVLSAASCKNLRQRQVLLSMCGIFTGLYLQNREEALLYAKLNHSQNKKHILRQQTLLQQIGFAYYNLAIHELYLCNRQTFLHQATTNFRKSIELNPDNYLVHYCLASIYTRQFSYDLAYKHIMECCKSGRGQWVPFSLLACIYFCQRRVTKATLIIEELLKKYTNTKLLHYFRAYLEVNRLLLEVEYDEQVQAAKVMGEDIYELCKERILKAKTSINLLKYCQQYHQLSLGKPTAQYDENYFMQSMILNPDTNLQNLRDGAGYQEGQGEQAILQIIPLLLEAGQTTITENLIKGLPASPLKTFYKAVLYQSKKQISHAVLQYKSVLMQQPYHTPTLINLAMIDEDICDALHYIDVAEKFTKDGKLWLAKGLLLSKLGRVAEANELFLLEGEYGWLQLQPDLIYYY